MVDKPIKALPEDYSMIEQYQKDNNLGSMKEALHELLANVGEQKTVKKEPDSAKEASPKAPEVPKVDTELQGRDKYKQVGCPFCSRNIPQGWLESHIEAAHPVKADNPITMTPEEEAKAKAVGYDPYDHSHDVKPQSAMTAEEKINREEERITKLSNTRTIGQPVTESYLASLGLNSEAITSLKCRLCYHYYHPNDISDHEESHQTAKLEAQS